MYYPNNKVTIEFFMSDIFQPTNFWRAKFYLSKERSFVWDWEIFCWTMSNDEMKICPLPIRKKLIIVLVEVDT